jgi:hypothetical protein
LALLLEICDVLLSLGLVFGEEFILGIETGSGHIIAAVMLD